VVLQQEISREEMQKLLETGKTSLLRGFVSNKTRRKFSAFLTSDAATGKVSFEFEPRVAKAGAKSAAKAAAKPAEAAAEKVGAGETAAKPVKAKLGVVKKVPAAKRGAKKA
jgi:DNA topoisomerase-3